MAITHPRSRKPLLAFAHQANFATAALATAPMVYAQAEDFQIARGAEYLYVGDTATTGSEFPRASGIEAARAPKAKARFIVGSRALLAFLQEHATHGLPTATQAAGDIAPAGTSAALLTAFSLTGIRPVTNCTAKGLLYAKLEAATPGAGQGRVSLYSDSARTALVAQGSATYGASVTLAAQNASLLSGSVTLGSLGVTSDLTGTTVTVSRVRAARSGQIARWFTLFADTGANGELETLSGCTVSKLEIKGAGDRHIVVEVEIVGAVYARTAHTANLALTVSDADLETLPERGAAFTHNATAQSVWNLSHGIEHEIWAPCHISATPVCVQKLSSSLLPLAFEQRLSDEAATIMTDGIAQTLRAVSAVYSRGARQWSWSYTSVTSLDPDMPAFKDGEHEAVSQELWAGEQNVASPADPLSVFIDL